jgi:hypothetical protein
MGVLPNIELMPDDDDETYVKHVTIIVLGWTALVITAAIMLALLGIFAL